MSNTRRLGISTALTFLVLLAIGACTVRNRSASSEPLSVQTPPAVEVAEPQAEETAPFQAQGRQPTSAQIPIEPDDAIWGSPTAPVTIVVFSDLECPFCARVMPTLAALQRSYGPGRLRLVWKHNPLPFHRHAKSAAAMAQAVLLTGGPEAFYRFVDHAFADQKRLGTDDLSRKVSDLGLRAQSVTEIAGSPAVTQKIEQDIALAVRLDATGTPAFRINGITVSGAQPLEVFKKHIDAELAETAKLAGTPEQERYGKRVAANFKSAPQVPELKNADEPDLKIWRVPITGAASEGPADALVTIVAFYDYQCPFCKRAQDTIKQLRGKYPNDVRVVVRHNPLPFHPRAKAAATLVVEARTQRGDAAFFEAQRRVFESQPQLEDTDLLKIAADMKLITARVQRALTKESHNAILDADTDLAAGFQARGTPHFFVNGVRLSGAQPLEKFVEAVERERAVAQALIDKGLPKARVFSELMKTAHDPDPPEHKVLPAPTANNPSRGPAKAAIVIQVFSDFQCPFCKRVLSTLKDVDRRFPGRVRWVWYNLPLAFHNEARPAARAALEARAQRGDAGFWKMHDLLFEGQTDPDGLKDDALVAHAQKLGLDVARFKAALRDGRHDAAIDADLDVAQKAGISGTPAFAINGYYVSGSQPIGVFARIADYALKHPLKAKPLVVAAPAAAGAKP